MTNPRKLKPEWDFAYLVMRLLYGCLNKIWGRRWKGETFTIEDEHDLPPQIRIKQRSGGEYIIFIRRAIPDFESGYEEMDFWDEHDVNEFYWEPATDVTIALALGQHRDEEEE